MKYLISVLILIAIGCATTKRPKPVVESIKIVTVYDTLSIRDTLISIKSDTLLYDALVECDSLNIIKTKQLTLINKTKPGISYIIKTDTIYLPGKNHYKIRTFHIQKTISIYREYWWILPLFIWAMIMTIFTLGSYIQIKR